MVFTQVEEGDCSVLEAKSDDIDQWRGLDYSDLQVVLGDTVAEEGERVNGLTCEYVDQAEGFLRESDYLIDVGNWMHDARYLKGELIMFDRIGLLIDEDYTVSFAEDDDSLELEKGTGFFSSFDCPLAHYVMVSQLHYLTGDADVSVLVEGNC